MSQPSLVASLKTSPSAAAFVRAQREHIPLETLKASLYEQERSLSASLTERLQSEFPALLDISKDVGSAEDRLRQLCDTIDAQRSAASDFAEGVQRRLLEFQSAVDERSALLQKVDSVRLLRRLADALGGLESLVAVSETDTAHDEAVAATASRLLRASGECGRLLLLKRRAAELPAAQRQAERIGEARSALLAQLSACLGRAMAAAAHNVDGTSSAASAASAAVLSDLLWSFGLCEAEDEAGRWVREQWVTPHLVPELAAAAKTGASLSSMTSALLGFVEGPRFAPLARADAASRRPLHLLCAGAWVEWSAFVGDRMGHAFGAGIPDTFHAAYTAVEGALATLEALMPSAVMRRHLRSHAATAAVRKRFNLPIYYQLRVVEVSKLLETALASTAIKLKEARASEAADAAATSADADDADDAASPPPAPVVSTVAADALLLALRRSLSPRVVLSPLAARFLRLTLQCVSRFDGWLGSLLPADGESAGAPPRMPPPAPSLAADAPTAAASAQPSQPLSDAEAACALYLDVTSVVRWLQSELPPRLPRLLCLPPAARLAAAEAAEAAVEARLPEAALAAECVQALSVGTASLAAKVARLRGQLVAVHTAACTALLAPVRAIAASYRMTGKAVPTRPSFFIPNVLAPLRAFLAAAADRLPSAERAVWAAEVAALVTRQYLALASSTLDTVRKNEQALLRLNAKKQAAAAAPGVTDSHKICVQLCLDVQAFGEELAAVGVPPQDLAAFGQLQDEVRPPEEEAREAAQPPAPSPEAVLEAAPMSTARSPEPAPEFALEPAPEPAPPSSAEQA